MRFLFLILAALVVSAPAKAQDYAPLNLTYVLYAGGLRVVNITWSYNLTSKTYDMHAIAKTTGIWSSLVPWRNMISVRGSVDATGVHPEMARYDDVWKEKSRTTEFTFGKDGSVSSVSTPPHKLGNRVEATDEQKKGTYDPLSAVVNVVVLGGAQGCQGKLPAYDGRRIYNLVLNNKGTEELKKSSYNLYAGPAVRCEVTFEPVAGFPEKETRAGFWNARDNSKESNPLIIWIASPSAGMPELPVKVQSTVQLGTIVAHLRVADPVNPAPAELPKP